MITPALPKISSSRYLGHLPATRTPAYILVGQDGGQSVSMNGKTLFFFSDTLVVCEDDRVATGHPAAPIPVPRAAQTVFLANCAAIGDGPDLEKAVSTLCYFHDADGLPREILPPTDRERFRNLRFWPEHGIWLDGKVYFYYLGIQTIDPSSIWGFQNLGVGLAVLDPLSGQCRRLEYLEDWVFWRNSGDDLHLGVHVLQVQEFVYLFGSLRNNLQNSAFLARVPANRIADRDAYEYLASTEPSWSPDFAAACTLGPSAAEYSVSYNPYLEKFTMLYVEEYRKRLMLRTAGRLWGPYSPPIDLIGVPHKESSTLIYLGFEHAAFRQQNGRKIFLSYCEPNFSPASLMTLTFDRTGKCTMTAPSEV